MYLEQRARSLRSRMRLFGRTTATDIAHEHKLVDVTTHASRQLATTQWTVVEIRRVYRAASAKDPDTGASIRGRNGRTLKNPEERGDSWRSIRPCATLGTRQAALATLAQIADAYDAAVWTGTDGVPRIEIRVMPRHVRQWPITIHEFALSSFEDEWNEALIGKAAEVAASAASAGALTVRPIACLDCAGAHRHQRDIPFLYTLRGYDCFVVNGQLNRMPVIALNIRRSTPWLPTCRTCPPTTCLTIRT